MNLRVLCSYFSYQDLCDLFKSLVTLSIAMWSYKEPYGFIKSFVTLLEHVALSIALWSYKESYGVIKSF